jgi:hypothetical protein
LRIAQNELFYLLVQRLNEIQIVLVNRLLFLSQIPQKFLETRQNQQTQIQFSFFIIIKTIQNHIDFIIIKIFHNFQKKNVVFEAQIKHIDSHKTNVINNKIAKFFVVRNQPLQQQNRSRFDKSRFVQNNHILQKIHILNIIFLVVAALDFAVGDQQQRQQNFLEKFLLEFIEIVLKNFLAQNFRKICQQIPNQNRIFIVTEFLFAIHFHQIIKFV